MCITARRRVVRSYLSRRGGVCCGRSSTSPAVDGVPSDACEMMLCALGARSTLGSSWYSFRTKPGGRGATADSGGSEEALVCSATCAMPTVSENTQIAAYMRLGILTRPRWNSGTSDLGVSQGSAWATTPTTSGCSGTSERSHDDRGDGALKE